MFLKFCVLLTLAELLKGTSASIQTLLPSDDFQAAPGPQKNIDEAPIHVYAILVNMTNILKRRKVNTRI
jgi:hypothetical protein